MREAREETGKPGLLNWEVLALFSLFAMELVGSYFAVGAVLVLSLVPQLTTPLMGVLVDRLGRRRVIAGAAALHGGASAVQAFTDSYAVFAGLAFISGFGAAAWLAGSTTLLADFTRVANRGRLVALRNVIAGLGFMTGPVLGGALASAFDLSAVFILGAVTKAPIVVLVLFLVREMRPTPSSAPEAEQSPRRRLRLGMSLFKTRDFLALSVVALALGLAATTWDVFEEEFAERAGDLGVPAVQTGIVFSVLGLLALLVAILVGSLVDRWGRIPVLMAGLATFAMAMFLAPWPNSLPMTAVLLGVAGIAGVMVKIALETRAMDLAPEDRKGYFLGTWLLVMDLSRTLAGVLAGAAVLMGVPLALGTAGVALLGAAAFLAASRPSPP